MTRRSRVRLGAVLAGTATMAAILAPTGPAAGADSPREPVTTTVTGRIAPGGPDWRYLPIDVPAGATRLTVRYDYLRSDSDGHSSSIDLGLFDPSGYQLGNSAGFRGWSGGELSQVSVSAADASPGYLPGPVERGQWYVVLGPYQVAPEGVDYRVTATVSFDPVGPPARKRPAPLTVNRTPGWYRGDLHNHSVDSANGGYSHQQVVDQARAAGLDFINAAEHDTSSAQWEYGATDRDGLLVLAGEEVTTRSGHWNAAGVDPGTWVDWRYRAFDGQLPRFTDLVRDRGGLVIANHPFGPFKGGTWEYGYDEVDAIEVWNNLQSLETNEKAIAAWDALLRAGRRITAIGASDAHRPGDPVGQPQNAVRARGLSRAAIVAGLRRGRVYVALNRAVSLRFTATAGESRAGIGGTLKVHGDRRVDVRLAVSGAPAGSVVRFVTDDGLAGEQPVAGGAGNRLQTRAGKTRYVRAEVRAPDGSLVALTNPIRLAARGHGH